MRVQSSLDKCAFQCERGCQDLVCRTCSLWSWRRKVFDGTLSAAGCSSSGWLSIHQPNGRSFTRWAAYPLPLVATHPTHLASTLPIIVRWTLREGIEEAHRWVWHRALSSSFWEFSRSTHIDSSRRRHRRFANIECQVSPEKIRIIEWLERSGTERVSNASTCVRKRVKECDETTGRKIEGKISSLRLLSRIVSRQRGKRCGHEDSTQD